jgi:hypothetical protein
LQSLAPVKSKSRIVRHQTLAPPLNPPFVGWQRILLADTHTTPKSNEIGFPQGIERSKTSSYYIETSRVCCTHASLGTRYLLGVVINFRRSQTLKMHATSDCGWEMMRRRDLVTNSLSSSSCPAPANRDFSAGESERPFSSLWIVLARDLRIICSGFRGFPGFVEVLQVLFPQFPLRLT